MSEMYPCSIEKLSLDKITVENIVEYHQQFVCPTKEVDIVFVPERENVCYRNNEDYYTIQYSTKMFSVNPIYGLYTAVHEVCHAKEFGHTNVFQDIVDNEMDRWDIEPKYARVYPYEFYYNNQLSCGPHGGLPTSMFTVGEQINIEYNNFFTEGKILKCNKMTVRVGIETDDEYLSYLLSPALISKKQEDVNGYKHTKSTSLCEALDGEKFDR